MLRQAEIIQKKLDKKKRKDDFPKETIEDIFKNYESNFGKNRSVEAESEIMRSLTELTSKVNDQEEKRKTADQNMKMTQNQNPWQQQMNSFAWQHHQQSQQMPIIPLQQQQMPILPWQQQQSQQTINWSQQQGLIPTVAFTQKASALQNLLNNLSDQYADTDNVDTTPPYTQFAKDINKLSAELLKIQMKSRGQPLQYAVQLMMFFFSKNEISKENCNVLGNGPRGQAKKDGLDPHRVSLIEQFIKATINGEDKNKEKQALWMKCVSAMNKKMS